MKNRRSMMKPEEFHNILYKLASYSGSLVAPTLGVFALALSTSKRRKYVRAFVEELRSGVNLIKLDRIT